MPLEFLDPRVSSAYLSVIASRISGICKRRVAADSQVVLYFAVVNSHFTVADRVSNSNRGSRGIDTI